jgi:hypothetical protein
MLFCRQRSAALRMRFRSRLIFGVCVAVLNVVAHVVATARSCSGTQSERFECRLNDLSSQSISCNPLAAFLVEIALSPTPRSHLIFVARSISWSIQLPLATSMDLPSSVPVH